MGNCVNLFNGTCDIIDNLYSYDVDMTTINILNPLFEELKLNVRKKLKNNRGYYLFLDVNNNIHLYMYKKLSKEPLSISLPLSFNEYSYNNNNENYISIVLDNNGRDYLGQTSKKKIDNMISQYNMEDLEKPYELINLVDANLEKSLYTDYKTFAEETLDYRNFIQYSVNL